MMMRITDADNKPIPGTDNELRRQGQDVCDALNGGTTPDQLVDDLEIKTSRHTAKVIFDVSTSVERYCPDYNGGNLRFLTHTKESGAFK